MSKFDPYNHFGFLTNRVGRLLQFKVAPKLKAAGYDMPTSCIGILAELWMQDGITQKELGCSLIKTKSSINKMLESLEHSELIVKKNDPRDKRNNLIFLTKKGKALRTSVDIGSQKMESQLLSEMSPEDIQIAKKVLKTLYINLSEHLYNQKIDE